jgi:hypothetical protein
VRIVGLAIDGKTSGATLENGPGAARFTEYRLPGYRNPSGGRCVIS